MKTKKIFITGVAGFLGSHLADWFINHGYEVSGCDNLIGGYIDNIPKDVNFWEVDCNNVTLMKKILKDIDIVYHCAASPYEGLSVYSPHIVNQNTYMSTISMLVASAHNKIKRFVFTSSMARYGKGNPPFTEDLLTKPQDPYGIAKVASEMTVRNICESNNIEWVIAVPHNIIGTRQKYDDPFRNVASIFINRMLQGKQPIIYGDGEQKRCFSFINECLFGLKEMALNDSAVGHIINIGPDNEFITINQLSKEIAKQLDFKLKPIYLPDRPCEVKNAYCSSKKIKRLFDYEIRKDWKEGIKEMIEWIKERGAKPFDYHMPIEFENEDIPKTWTKRLM